MATHDPSICICHTMNAYSRMICDCSCHAVQEEPVPAADQTPATDSQRVEQIRARWYEHHIDPTDRDARILLLTEVDVPWLLALIAGQAATIEDLGQTRAEDLNYQRGLEGRISAVQKAAETLLPFDQRNILAALGGHDLTQTPSGVRP